MTCPGCANPSGGLVIVGCRAAPTVHDFRNFIDYDPATGELRWKSDARRPAGGHGMKRSGMLAGSVSSGGYLVFCMLGRQYKAHRVAWLMYYGSWPKGFIDHKNRVRTDNRIENLRDATPTVNAENRNKPRTSKNPLPGVKAIPSSGHFSAKIVTAGRCSYLGTFETAEVAHAAYVEAKRRLHEGNTL